MSLSQPLYLVIDPPQFTTTELKFTDFRRINSSFLKWLILYFKDMPPILDSPSRDTILKSLTTKPLQSLVEDHLLLDEKTLPSH